MPCKSAREAGRDTWGTSFNDGFPRSRDNGCLRRAASPPATARPSARWDPAPPAGPPALAPSQADARARLPALTRVPRMRCGSSRSKARPLPWTRSPASRARFQERVQRVGYDWLNNDEFNNGLTTCERLVQLRIQLRVQRVNGIIGVDLFP